ncbi:hypothetical protein D3C81_1676590 [compost metagenome]
MAISSFKTVSNPAWFSTCDSPSIVNTDQDANHIWFQADCIFIPASIQVGYTVSTYPAVNKKRIILRILISKSACYHVSVAMSQYMIFIVSTVSITVCNRITLKQNNNIILHLLTLSSSVYIPFIVYQLTPSSGSIWMRHIKI